MKNKSLNLSEMVDRIIQEYEVETLPKPKTKPTTAPEKEKSPSPLTPPKEAPKTNPKAFYEIEGDILKKVSSRYASLKEGGKDRLTSLIREVIMEVSAEQLKQQWVDTGKISDEVFQEILDVSKNKSAYATWLVKRVAEGSVKEEDIYKFEKYFHIFDNNKNKYPIKDIGKIQSEVDPNTGKVINDKNVKDFIRISSEIAQQNKEDPSSVKGASKSDKYKEFYIGSVEGFDVYELPKGRKDLYGASCELGSGTEWCTATGNSRKHFDNYISQGPLFIFINQSNPKEKYQFSYESNQFMDAKDQSIL